jgi:uncharacterized protein (TIGR00159 family)
MIELFIPIRIIDIIDILLVAFLLYELYKLIKGTVAINIFIGIVAFYLLWKLVDALKMEMLSEILGGFVGVGVIALIIVFQQEIRRFLLLLGNPDFFRKMPLRFLFSKWKASKSLLLDINAIVDSCEEMANKNVGALIVVIKQNELELYIKTGETIDAKISKSLIENIFFKNSPLHDGAIIIDKGRIKAARCILPSTEKTKFPVNLGLRHRAAVGITEQSDAITIVVSEQTGQISYSKSGKLTTNVKPNELKIFLKQEFRN